MSDKIFNILFLTMLVFLLGVFTGEYLSCKEMGLRYSWDYGTCKGGGENE